MCVVKRCRGIDPGPEYPTSAYVTSLSLFLSLENWDHERTYLKWLLESSNELMTAKHLARQE